MTIKMMSHCKLLLDQQKCITCMLCTALQVQDGNKQVDSKMVVSSAQSYALYMTQVLFYCKAYMCHTKSSDVKIEYGLVG